MRNELDRNRAKPAEQVENNEAERSHGILYIIAEYIQKPHVEDQVQPASMHKHGGNWRKSAAMGLRKTIEAPSKRNGCSSTDGFHEFAWDQAELADGFCQGRILADSLEKNPRCYIQSDYRKGRN